MRKIITLLFILIPLFAFADESEFKEGDLVFQMSKSKQSPFVAIAQGSLYTHCGIIIFKNNIPYVLEAANVVKLTKLSVWANKGRFKSIKVKRVFNKNIKINYKQYLGKKYDLMFKFDNNKYYCSELIYNIYKNQFNYELCKPKPVHKYNTFGLEKIMKKRGINKNQLVVAPSDILDSNKCFYI